MIFPGMPIGNQLRNNRGTLGAVLKDTQGEIFLLSCAHVLADNVDDYHRAWGGPSLLNPPAFSPSSSMVGWCAFGMFGGGLDFAVTGIGTGQVIARAINRTTHWHIREFGSMPRPGENVFLFGGVTGELKRGTVIGPDAIEELQKDFLGRIHKASVNTYEVVGPGVAYEGDSGGPVIDVNNRLVAIVIASSPTGGTAWVLPTDTIRRYLRESLEGDHPGALGFPNGELSIF